MEGTGLNRTARELRIDPSWLSRRLSLRKDPVVFPALEAGRLSFRQASELLHAPAAVRRTLLDRALRERASGEVIRKWAYDAREEVKRGQQDVAAGVATEITESPRLTVGERIDRMVAELKAVQDQLASEDVSHLQELVRTATELLNGVRPSSGESRATTKRPSLESA